MPRNFGLILALLAVDGLHFVFARALHAYLPPVTAALCVLGVGTTLVTAYAAFTHRLHWEQFRRQAGFFLSIGALVASSTAINYAAVAYVDPGAASLLAQTSILFGLMLGVWWLKERLRPGQWVGAALSLVGAAVVTFQPGDYFRWGSFLIILGSLLYALHGALVKRYGGQMDLVTFFAFRLLVTTGFLAGAAAAQGQLAWPPAAAWPLLGLAGLVDVVISRTLYYTALRRLNVSLLSLVTTISPVVAVLWSLALFGTRPSVQDLVGGAAILAGLGVIAWQRERAG